MPSKPLPQEPLPLTAHAATAHGAKRRDSSASRLGSVIVTAAMAMCAASAEAGAGADGAPPMEAPHATVELSSDRPEFAAGEPVHVRVTLTNPTIAPVAILRWLTPLDGVDRPLFDVRRDGVEVRYLGRVMKRPPPVDSDYETLAPGASIAAEVDLAKLYALTAPGHYDVSYAVTSNQLYRRPGGNSPAVQSLTSQPLRLVVAAND